MSSDGFNAENRNNINIIITNNIINDWPRAYMGRFINHINDINNANRCSFCNGTGHNIRTCTDTRITDFEEECRMSKSFCEWTENPHNTFKEWLMEYYLVIGSEVVKAFAVSKCNCRVSSNIDVVIDSVTSYIYEDQNEDEDQTEEDQNEEDQTEALDEVSIFDMEAVVTLLSMQESSSNRERTDKFNIIATVKTGDAVKMDEVCDCSICFEDDLREKNFVALNCQHKFCKDCFKGSLKNTPNYKDLPTCALCRADISAITVHDENVKNELTDLIEFIE